MNKHTLNYHTRLHDWYRQHSIQLQKQEVHHHHQSAQKQQQQRQQQQQYIDPAGTGEVLPSEGGNLTQDKLHAIHDWCADVNRNLFRVKKRETPPLFRRCRVTSASTVASRTSSAAAWGRQQTKGVAMGSGSLQIRSADPRRVRSAEVFTVSGHWAKQPKAKVTGGELLAKRPMTAPRNIYNPTNAQSVKQAPDKDLEFCVRNSRDTGDPKDADDKSTKVLPRVNHDSLTLRSNALVLKQNGPRLTERMPNSPRDYAISTFDPGRHSPIRYKVCASCNTPGAVNMRSAKSAKLEATTGVKLRFMDEAGGVSKVLDTNTNTQDLRKDQQTVENTKTAKHDEKSRDAPGTNKVHGQAGMKVIQESRVIVNHDHQEKLPVMNGRGEDVLDEPADTLLHVKPGFCNTCSGIYSDECDNATVPTCGNCIHGINVDSTQQLQRNIQQQRQHKENYHILQRVSPKLSPEERLTVELQKAEAEVSRVENRLSENGIHYSAERAAIREEHRGSGCVRPGTSSAAQLRARLAAQLALDEDTEEDQDVRDGSEYSDDELPQPEAADLVIDGGDAEGPPGTADKRVHVTIITDRDQEHGRHGEEQVGHGVALGDIDPKLSTADQDDIECGDDDDEANDEDGESPDLSMKNQTKGGSRGERRKSISFGYKPVIAAPSVSNGLLNVLSIDDCKFHMRYSPHKVLEEHEITENLMLPLALLQFNSDNDNSNNDTSQQQPQNETNSKVAMRISRGSSPENIYTCGDHTTKGFSNSNEYEAVSPNTSIRSSSARRATVANVRKFRALNDPEDIEFLSHQRPKSVCLARAFYTLIHDRTVMQRFDNPINKGNNKTNARSYTVDDSVRPTKIARKGTAVVTARSTDKSPRHSGKFDGKRTAGARGAKKWDVPDEHDSPTMTEGGPRYRLINAALRRHMGDLLQEQCKKFQVRYQRQKNASSLRVGGKKNREGNTSPSVSPAPSLSLSLDSLPQTKKGILKTATSPGGHGLPTQEDLPSEPETPDVQRGEGEAITSIQQ